MQGRAAGQAQGGSQVHSLRAVLEKKASPVRAWRALTSSSLVNSEPVATSGSPDPTTREVNDLTWLLWFWLQRGCWAPLQGRAGAASSASSQPAVIPFMSSLV